MAITKEQKEAQVAQLVEDFGDAKMTVLTNYQGLDVESIQELRKLLKEQGCNYRVVKNTLIQLAAKHHAAFKDVDTQVFDGPMALAFGFEDEVAPAQVIANFAKSHPEIEFIGAINAAGETLSADQVKYLASLPSKQQLLGQLVGTIAAPLSGFVRVMGGNLQGIVQVMSKIRDQKVKA